MRYYIVARLKTEPDLVAAGVRPEEMVPVFTYIADLMEKVDTFTRAENDRKIDAARVDLAQAERFVREAHALVDGVEEYVGDDEAGTIRTLSKRLQQALQRARADLS